MADSEGDVTLPTATGGQMSVEEALQEVLKKAVLHNGITRGLRETVKVLDKRQALLCVLAENCDEPNYVKLVEGLCNEHNINLIKVPENKKLGEMVGLCKIDKEGNPRKVVACSSVAVTSYGEDSEALNVLTEYFKKR